MPFWNNSVYHKLHSSARKEESGKQAGRKSALSAKETEEFFISDCLKKIDWIYFQRDMP